MADDEQPASAADAPEPETDAPQDAAADEQARDAAETAPAPEPVAEASQDAAETAPAVEPVAEASRDAAETPGAEPVAEASQEPAEEPQADAAPEEPEDDEDEEEPAPREKPAVPGAHLEVDIVPEGVDPLGRGDSYQDAYAIDPYAIDEENEEPQADEDDQEEVLAEPISTAAIDLASGARYRATGKRKSAIARVTLRPGTGSYVVNGRTLEQHFPRLTLQRNIRQPLETVGYEDRMDVVARLHGGGISAQAGALRHGVSRALLEADPNLRGELKRRGFLTRDSRAKERKKAGLKKARKRPQFSKR
jgi:small subunit ribosomal protein S9